MDRIINWGIIGIGKIAEKFASDLKNVPNCKIVAAASSDVLRAKEFASRHEIKNYFGNYNEIFKVKELDVVYIATPHTAHHECTLMCLKNNVAVLCEKPFAMNESQVDEMIACSKERQTFLMEALWTRYLPTTLKMLEWIKAGRIGEIKSVHADFGFIPPFLPDSRTLNPEVGGGAFLDIGIYPAFLSYLLLGYPSKILATATSGPTDVDETTSFIYQYDDKAMATLSCSFGAETETEAIIYGTKGFIKLHKKFHESKMASLHISGEEPEVFEAPRDTFGYDYEAAEVNDCLRKGLKESPLWSLKDSKTLIHLLDKTREKAGITYREDRVF